jgi:hypothetical protein
MTAYELIDWKRKRQILKGYSAEHDDKHEAGELANAAAFLAIDVTHLDLAAGQNEAMDGLWPDSWPLVGQRDRIHELAHAGALIVAEIERLQRLQARQAERAGLAGAPSASDLSPSMSEVT